MSGSGAYNSIKTFYMQPNYSDTKIVMLDQARMPAEAKESVTFVSQVMEAIIRRSIPVPDWVKTKQKDLIGKVSPGRNYRKVMKHGMQFGGEAERLEPVGKMANFVRGTCLMMSGDWVDV